MNRPPTPETDCADTDRRVRAVLDRDLPASALAGDHARSCPECGRRIAEAYRFLRGLGDHVRHQDVRLPADFADRVVVATVRDGRRRRTRRVAWQSAVAALAASVIAAVVIGRAEWDPIERPVAHTRPTATATAPTTEPVRLAEARPPVRMTAELSGVGDALAALSRRTADGAFGPAQTLIPGDPPDPPAPRPESADLAGVPDAARSGLAPLTGSAERAFHLFMRDVGSVAQAKPSS